jgi:hypothetical protein
MNEIENKVAKLENLSQLWAAYGDLLLKSDRRDREREAERAFGISADYLHAVISVYEKESNR